jgi:hypothetical protein
LQEAVEYMELPAIREHMHAAVQRLMGGDERAEKDIDKYDKVMRSTPRVRYKE